MSFSYQYYIILFQCIFLSGNLLFAKQIDPPSFGNIREELPHDIVHDIFEDSNGFIWFATKDGLCRYDGAEFVVYRELLDHKSISNGRISCIVEDYQGNIWAGTEKGLNKVNPFSNEIHSFLKESHPLLKDNHINDLYFSKESGILWIATKSGISLYDAVNEEFIILDGENPIFDYETRIIGKYAKGEVYIGTHKGMHICDETGKYNRTLSIKAENRDYIVFSAYRDQDGQIWLGTNLSALSKIDMESELIIPLHIQFDSFDNHSQIVGITENDSILWLISRLNGILFYDKHQNQLLSFGDGPSLHPHETNSDKSIRLTSIFKDSHGTIWIGSYYLGVFFHSSYLNQFRYIPMTKTDNLPIGVVGNIIADEEGGIWLGSLHHPVIYLDTDDHSSRFYNLYNESSVASSNPLFRKDNVLWLATDGTGISVFNLDTKKVIRRYGIEKEDKLPSRRINCGLHDSMGRIWIGFNGTLAGGICRFDDETETFITYSPPENSLSVKDVYFIFEISENELWLGTRNNGLFSYRINENTFTPIPIMEREDLAISYIFKDTRERIWIGTFGQGLICMNESAEIKQVFNNTNGINNNICGIIEDVDGRIWISSFYEIAYFNEEAEIFIKYDSHSNFPIQHVMPLSCLSYPGKPLIYFGGRNGLVEINPRELIHKRKDNPKIILTDILINNKQVEAADRHKALNKNNIYLKHDQNNLTFSFAVLDFIYPEKNECHYFLEGIDNEWHTTGIERQATYNSLPSGKYTFKVKSYRDGFWTEEIALVTINLKPAPWFSWWAYTLYVLFVLMLFGLFLYYQRTKIILEHRLDLQNVKLKHRENMHRFRIDLFTNFSHEIRTPLTLISEPLDDLLEQSPVADKKVIESLRGIQVNVNKIMKLVNQLMDYRRHEERKMELKASEGAIYPFIQHIISNFSELSVIQSHKVIFTPPTDELKVWYNPQLLEKVFYNVLMNAFKYSEDNTPIVIDTAIVPMDKPPFAGKSDRRFDEALLISLFNEGENLPEDKLEKIFEPFYRLNKAHSEHSSGIGLSLNKMIMQLHHGSIWAENIPGKGIMFKILLPLGCDHLQEKEFADSDIENTDEQTLPPSHHKNKETGTEKSPSLLLVEDNNEIRNYLKSKLSPYYTLYDCSNGKDALKIVKSKDISLIITDIMMPEMSGIELCEIIKGDIAFNHIPIILLTANESESYIQKGFEAGANDYVIKPFRFDILLARIQSQLSNYERLRNTFQKQINPQELNVEVTDYDQQFLQKCYNYLKENISNPDLNVENLSKEVGLSRVHFYRKIKYLTNMSPSRFILNIRLKVAADLLNSEGVSVSEVCYQVGFNNLSYFTKCFKEEFGVLPSAFHKKTD